MSRNGRLHAVPKGVDYTGRIKNFELGFLRIFILGFIHLTHIAAIYP
jgi:hypothetical protein